MAKSDGKQTARMRFFEAKGIEASQLRRRRHLLTKRFGLPASLLGGSLVLSHRRCGKPGCWCVQAEQAHPHWTLTYSVGGRKQVENIPAEWVEQLMPLVQQGQAYREALAELRAINAQLLKLWRLQQRRRLKPRR